MFSAPVPQRQELDLISFLAQEPSPAQVFQIVHETQLLRKYVPEIANEKKNKMVRAVIESGSGQTTTTSSFGIPLTTISNHNGRTTSWGARVNNVDGQPLGWRRLSLIIISLCLCMLIVSLDRTILSTAIPTITDEFHSLGDVGWYGSLYLLTSCATQLIYVKIYKFYNHKWILMIAIAIFEVGSAICGSASSSKVFIVGRAIAGLGSAGTFNGVLLIMTDNVPIHKRPIFMDLFGGVFAISNVSGPLLGGVLTSRVSWRWCFLPQSSSGGVAAFILFFVVQGLPSKNTDTLRQKLQKMDRLGTLIFIPAIICIILALQWGGNTYKWVNSRIIILFILGGTLLILFTIIQFKSGENATIPIRVIKQRSIASVLWFSFFNSGSLYILIYYLPIWFQVTQELNAINSGLHTLPLVLALVLGNLFARMFKKATGYYVPMVIASSIIASVGAGFLITLQTWSGPKHWMAYQVIFGWGIGLGIQQAILVVQACLSDDDASTGLALMFFAQGLGGSIFITIGQVIFSHELVKNLSALNLPSLPTSIILHSGAMEIRNIVPSLYVEDVLGAYNKAVTKTFIAAIVTSALTIFAGLTMEWKNIKNVNRNTEIEVTSPFTSFGGSGSDEERPNTVHHVGDVEHDDPGTDDKGTINHSLKLTDLQRQQLETIREEREKSSSAETSADVVKSSGGVEIGTGVVEEKVDDEIRVVG